MTKRLKTFLPFVGLLGAVGASVLLLRSGDLYRTVELKTLDWRFRSFSEPAQADKDIVLAVLDQPSLDHFEKDGVYWPWPRTLYGAALEFLTRAGAKAVVFDVLFTSPSPYGAEEDRAFAESVKRHGRVVLAADFGAEEHPLRAKLPDERFSVEPPAALAASVVAKRSARLPVPELAAAAFAIGDTSIAPDLDGVSRRTPLFTRMGGRTVPTLPFAAAAAFGASTGTISAALSDGTMAIRFHGKSLVAEGKPHTYEAYHLGDLVVSLQNLEEGKPPVVDPAAFKGKLVFVAMTAAGLLDNRPSPISEVFPGTEIVAAAADNLLHGDALEEAGTGTAAALLLAALLIVGLVSRVRRAGVAVGAVALASVLLVVVAVLAFRRGVWIEMLAPQLALWLGFAAASAYGYAVEGKQKRYVQGAFSLYLSPKIVEEIAADPERLSLGGERRDVTFYFSDIKGFTSFSEVLEPERLTKLMNRYLGEMTDTVLASGGTLDKYIGDAVMAFWGAPLPVENHALVACKAALTNQQRLVGLREEFAREGYPPVFNRIGLNSGPASIGNMGSPKRFSYTAIGDNVNLASRLEGANKPYGTYIMLSESTRQGAGDAIEVRELDYVKVKGKNVPIRVYELLGLKGETDAELLKKARRFEEALKVLRARKWDDAHAAFRAVISDFKEDEASELYLERIAELKAAPPPEDWDGSFALTEK